MKTFKEISKTCLGLMVLFCLATSGFAQQQGEQQVPLQNILKFKPLSFEFGYERALGSQFSVQLATRILPFKISVDATDASGNGSLSLNEYQFTPELRFYVFKKMGPLEGFFIAPHFKYGFMRLKGVAESNNDLRETVVFKGQKWGGGLTFGWQWVNYKGFSIDTQLGFGYTNRTYDDAEITYSDGTTEIERSGLENIAITAPRVGFSIGYAF